MFIDPTRIPSTGNAMIDAAHVRLAEVANEAYSQWRINGNSDRLADTFRQFFGMVENHFLDEERIIKGAGFDGWREHHDMHQKLLSELLSLISRLIELDTNPQLVFDIFHSVDRVLYQHEFLDDQEFWNLFRTTDQAATDEFISWEDAYTVGDGAVDDQHRALVKMLNRLHFSLREGLGDSEILAQLTDIETHSRWHFTYEEGLMKEIGMTAGLDAHKALHRNLLTDIAGVHRTFELKGRAALDNVVEDHLKFWLLDHILNVDKGIERHVGKNPGRPS